MAKTRLIGPPVYRPAHAPATAQPKNGGAPPVFRPHHSPQPVQLKSCPRPTPGRQRGPPPVYKPILAPQPLQVWQSAAKNSIQRCHLCNDNSCVAGEKCGKDPTFGGLFNVQGQIHVGPYKDVKKFSSKGKVEAEHMFSNQMNSAMSKQTGQKFVYGEMPAYSIDYTVHQQGRYGVGGGISSTGSSKTSKDWSNYIANLAVNDPKAAARKLVLDALNAHISQNQLTGDVMSAVLQVMNQVLDLWGVTLSTADKGEILNEMVDYYYAKL